MARGNCSVLRGEYEFVAPENSIVSDFDLVCNASLLVPMASTFFFLGFLFGACLLGSLSDARGRRRAYLLAILFVQVGALIAATAPLYSVYAVGRSITGFGVGGLGLTSYVWLAEVLGRDSRSTMVLTTNSAFALGCLFLAPLSYTVPEWRHQSLFVWVCGMPLIPLYGILLESPKWLASKQKCEQLHVVMCHIAAANSRRPPPAPRQPAQEATPQQASAEARIQVLTQLFVDRRLSQRFYAMCLAWFALSLAYYGMSMSASSLDSNVYVSFAVTSVVELPAYVAALWASDSASLGRRGATAGGLALGGACCICAAFASGTALLLLAYAGKFAVALAFATLYLYATELFPTSVRSRSMGLQSLMARFGSMGASVVADLGRTSRVLPMLIFGVPCLLAGFLVAGLPETRGRPLADTIDDVPLPEEAPLASCLRRYRQLDEDVRELEGFQQEATRGPEPRVIGVAA